MKTSEIRLRREKWSRQRKKLRDGVIVAASAVGATGAAIELGVWTPPRSVTFPMVGLLAVGSVASSVVGNRAENSAGQRERDRQEMQKIAAVLITELGDLTGIEPARIGVSVWTVHSEGKKKVDALAREMRFRLNPLPLPSDSAWTKGRGVIGRSWEKTQIIYVDWRPVQEQHKTKSAMSKSAWSGVSEKSRWGFGQNDFLDAIRKYEQVLAVPIVDQDGVFRGCVSVDVPPVSDDDVRDRSDEKSLGCDPARSMVTRAAENLHALLNKP